MAWSEHVVVRDRVRLACRGWGEPGQQPIVLLHGLAGHAGEWDVLARRLSCRYRVVAVDQRGHGASERHPRDVSRAAYGADVIAVVDQLALQRPVLVGQSLGGHTAMLTAAAHPGLVRALVLVEAGSGGPYPNGPVDIGGWLDSWPTPLPSRWNGSRIPRRRTGRCRLGGRAGRTRRQMVASLRPGRDGPLAGGERPAFLLARMDTGRMPHLVVLAQSSFIPAQEADEMLRQRPATIAMSIPGTGHDLHLEQPGILHTALSGFLEGLA
ncbi:alpha/beta fold hydrolase [Streptomyces sp. NPDC058295]|uniref:alpha/beta fold hydrolase n=1 Tax=Streptomyces sp. NPDC058295 TaxID=3346431 RepID=UPI0036F0E1CA